MPLKKHKITSSSFNKARIEKYTDNDCNVKGLAGRDGIGFKLTDDGNYDIDGKRLTNVADSIDDSDAVSLKVLKEHTQVSQNNYNL